MSSTCSSVGRGRLTFLAGALAVVVTLGACDSDSDGTVGSTEPTRSSTATTQSSTATTSVASNGGYEATGHSYAGPDIGGSTDPIVDPLPDGVYWSFTPSVSDDGSAISFELVQQFNGDECLAHFGTVPGACSGDIGFETATTTATLPVGSGTASVLFVDGIDAPKAFRITTEELARLLAGEPPAGDAPEGFVADPVDPFVVTVQNGSVVAADQIWIS